MQFGKFLRCMAALRVQREGEPQLAFEGDSLFSWDDPRQTIVYYIWGSDVSHRQLKARFIGEQLAFPMPSRCDPARVVSRSVWRRLGADAFEVRREWPNGSEWVTELTVVYRRSAPAR